MKKIAVLGATGSIGASALDVIARHLDRFEVVALTAQERVDDLLNLCARFRPRVAVIGNPAHHERLREGLRQASPATRAMAGPEALVEAAADAASDTVIAAIVGAAGLSPALAAARAGKRLLLANKEAVVMAGALFMREVAANHCELIPIDSEHNAIFQCLPIPALGAAGRPGIARLLLTASGGPFRGWTRERLASVTPAQACAHPRWSMGPKISVDSATLMNKGLEVIEAHWLFSAAPGRIEVVVHPQSIVHSLVEYADGSQLAQLGQPDMRTALAHALAWPERIEAGVARLDLAAIGRLEFETVDRAAFPCLDLAYHALQRGGAAPAVLNAANETAVAAFLAGRLGFLDIPRVISATLNAFDVEPVDTLDALQAIDAEARCYAAMAI